jgi:DNA polymerase III delta prime subunit
MEPQALEELVLKPATRTMLNRIVDDTMPLALYGKSGLMLYGPPGTGKTTAALLLPSLLDLTLANRPQKNYVGGWYSIMQTTGIMQREWSCGAGGGGKNRGVTLINEIDNTVANGQRGASGYAYIILNEADELGNEGLGSLRSLMGRYQNVVYIFTTNHLNKLEAAVMDRCYLLDFSAAGLSEWTVRCNQILAANGLEALSEDELEPLYTDSNGSARTITSYLHAAVTKGVLT